MFILYLLVEQRDTFNHSILHNFSVRKFLFFTLLLKCVGAVGCDLSSKKCSAADFWIRLEMDHWSFGVLLSFERRVIILWPSLRSLPQVTRNKNFRFLEC